MNKYWNVKAQSDKTGELYLYGDITSSKYCDEDVTPKDIDNELKALGDIDTLNVYVNSGGGSVYAGFAIYNMIKRHKAKTKNAYVDGLAASISSVIPMACDKIYMPKNSMLMIHQPSVIMQGKANDLRVGADRLDKIEKQIIDVYKEKTGLEETAISEMLEKETWLTAQEAIKLGFANELQEEIRIAASIDGDFLICNDQKVDTKNFKNFESVKNNFETYREEQTPQPVAIDLSEQQKEFRNLKLKLLGGM